MLNKKHILILFSVFALICFHSITTYAVFSTVQGDPETVFLSPLGKGEIKNDDYNRCLIIKKLHPDKGADKNRNNKYDILSEAVSKLYAHSLTVEGAIGKEMMIQSLMKVELLKTGKSLIEDINRKLADISRRMNIIVSLEASTLMLDSLWQINNLPPQSYSTFIAYDKSGMPNYSAEKCKDLK